MVYNGGKSSSRTVKDWRVLDSKVALITEAEEEATTLSNVSAQNARALSSLLACFTKRVYDVKPLRS